jgi:hypothetical protein
VDGHLPVDTFPSTVSTVASFTLNPSVVRSTMVALVLIHESLASASRVPLRRA